MISWLAQSLFASTMLMLLVLVFRKSVGRAFGPGPAYCLWALPAIRAVLPSLPTPFGLRSLPIASPLGFHPGLAFNATGITASPLADYLHENISVAVVGLWSTGAALWLLLQAARYRYFLRSALRDAVVLSDGGGMTILLSRAVDGPVATGILKRRIFLPNDFGSRYEATERRLAILHERRHHDRFDLLANLAGIIVLAAHWWNPVAHLGHRCFRSDQELACDASVTERLSALERSDYALALLKSATRKIPIACALSHASELRDRLDFLKRPRLSALRAALGRPCVFIVVCAGLAATASSRALPAAPVVLRSLGLRQRAHIIPRPFAVAEIPPSSKAQGTSAAKRLATRKVPIAQPEIKQIAIQVAETEGHLDEASMDQAFPSNDREDNFVGFAAIDDKSVLSLAMIRIPIDTGASDTDGIFRILVLNVSIPVNHTFDLPVDQT